MTELIFASLGLLTGGVLNVIADRVPPLDPEADGPFLTSHPRRLAWWEWLPVLSSLGALRARRMVIANNRLRYPLLEAATAAAFVLAGAGPIAAATPASPPGVWQAAVVCAFSAALLTLAAVDMETKYLPYRLSIPALVLGLAVAPLWPRFDWWEGYVAAAVGFSFFYGIYWLGRRLDRPLMGDGDAFLAAAVGAVLGISLSLLGFYITALLGGVAAFGVVIARAFGYKARVIPYGPYLVAGGLISLFYGRTILDALMPG